MCVREGRREDDDDDEDRDNSENECSVQNTPLHTTHSDTGVHRLHRTHNGILEYRQSQIKRLNIKRAYI